MKILSNVTTHTTKLIGKYGAMVQWRAGRNKEEFKESCEKANCAFLEGGQFINPISGKTIKSEDVVTSFGTITREPEYTTKDGETLMKVDKCFALFGTPMLSAYKWDTKFPDRIGIDGLRKAISEAPRNADRARGALVGNASTIMTLEEIREVDNEIRSAGMHHILYDHAWRQNPWILEFATASCNHLQDVKDAIALGARQCSLVMPQSLIDRYKQTKIDGFRFIQCPENLPGRISCINCGGRAGPLCDAQSRSGMVIMFEQHGSTSWKKSKASTMKNIALKAGVDVEELRKAIDEGNRPVILAIGKKAISNVTKATGRRYRRFMEIA